MPATACAAHVDEGTPTVGGGASAGGEGYGVNEATADGVAAPGCQHREMQGSMPLNVFCLQKPEDRRWPEGHRILMMTWEEHEQREQLCNKR
jgi:hypothetical protein